jgi:branched-chain amino acid transport system substrate-binding protein
VEGVMGVGAWNPKVPAPGAREFFNAYVKRWGKEPPRWGEASSYASLQIIDQAIQKTGSLDQKKLRDVIATDTFQTVIGSVKFEDGTNPNYPGDVGQWQKGEYEIVSPKDKRTAKPIYPKPNWPQPKKDQPKK